VCASLDDGGRAAEVVLALHVSRARGIPIALRERPAAVEPALADRVFLSVAIPTFERPRPLSTLLEALAGQRLPRDRFEVIVVDDSGTVSGAAVVQGFADRLDVGFLVEPRRGCAGARHAGCTRATGSHLVFTDDDCVPDPAVAPGVAPGLPRPSRGCRRRPPI
jgi:hypothetical protein